MKSIVFLSAIIVFLCACSSKKKEVEPESGLQNENIVTLTDIQVKNAGIATGRMAQKDISSILKVNGKIDVPPQNMVSVSVPLGGYLRTTKLLPGMHVSKGEVIAIMEDQQYIQLQQDYLSAKARINYLENEYLRQKELNQTKASSDKVFQLAEADYMSQKVLIAALAQKLQLIGINHKIISESTISRSINVYSPINGFVSKVNVNIGKYISPTEILFELVNPSDIHLTLKVFEKDLDKLFIGQKIFTYTNNQPNKKFLCKILLIGKDISIDRSTEVHCHFVNYDKTLIPGTYMNAEIELKTTKANVLPSDAIVNFESKNYIFKIKSNNQFEMMEVTLGESENGVVEIVMSQKKELISDSFVIKGAYSLLMTMKNKEE